MTKYPLVSGQLILSVSAKEKKLSLLLGAIGSHAHHLVRFITYLEIKKQQLSFKPLGAPAQTRTPKGPGTLELSARVSRIAAGHPEGFANIYQDAAEAIAARIAGIAADPLALHFPTSAEGLAGMLFIVAVVRSIHSST